MKYLKFLVFSLFLIKICILNVNAYTKEDIISLGRSFNSCSSKTTSLIKGTITSYERMLNEREMSSSDLDKIYNNLNIALETLKQYDVCSVDDKSNIPSDVLNNLSNLYDETNNIILSTPKLVDGETKTEANVVIDSATNQIKIYEDGALSDVIEIEEKLNYVGLNKVVIFSIIVMSILLILLVMLKILKFKNILIVSAIYILVLILPITILFRNKISLILNAIDSMNVNVKEVKKEIIIKDEKIISYPLYGDEYAQIYINDLKEDVYFGDSSSILKKGIGQKSSSYLPGENKTTILSGHNTGVFKELSSLKKDDEITIETVYGKFIYNMLDYEIVDETDVDILEKKYDLILYTCYPNSNLYGNKRIVVYANLESSEWLGGTYEE